MESSTQRWQRRFALPVIVAALATVPLLVFERHHTSGSVGTILRVADWVVWAVFAAETVVLIAVSPARWAWVRSHLLDMAVVVLTLPVLPVALQGLRVLRLLRLLRLARLGPVARNAFSLAGLRYAAFLALLAMLGGGEAFSLVEKNVSLGNGIYWALSTMTTVGYGDYVPRTAAGKVVASIVMVVGVAFFAMITGAIAQRFLAGEVREMEAEIGEVGAMVQEAERLHEVDEREILVEVRDLAERLRSLEERLRGRFETRST